MSAKVLHRRPLFDTAGLKAGLPVSADDWSHMAGLANWCNGHGGCLIPWTQVNEHLDDESITLNYYIAPKKRAVERVWYVAVAATKPVTITAGSASATTVSVPATSDVQTPLTGFFSLVEIREYLSAKTNTAAGTTIAIGTTEAGGAHVYGVGMYEQTRRVLDKDSSDDYGVDLTSCRPRQPIVDIANKYVRGVADGYKNLDARRPGLFHWATGTGSGKALAVTQASYTDLFPLYPPMFAAVDQTTSTGETVVVAVYAKVDAGTGQVFFESTANGDSATVGVTSTSFGWVTSDLQINTEDLSLADGRRGSAWETMKIQARKNTATTLTIAGISIIRTTAPI